MKIRVERKKLKLITAMFISLLLLVSVSSQTVTVTRGGARTSQKGATENFTGAVSVEPLIQAVAPSRLSGGNVTFEPGARSAWHTHPLGQTLIVTAGVGRVQSWGGSVED